MRNGKKITMFVLAAGLLLTGCGGGGVPAPTVTVSERVPAPVVTTPAPSSSGSRDSVADLLFPPSSSPTPSSTHSINMGPGYGELGARIKFCESSRRGNLTPDECLKRTTVLSDATVVLK